MSGFLAVCAGGALGAGGRYLINLAALAVAGPGFPWGTLTANVVGCFVMGAAAQWVLHHGGWSPEARLFIMTGVLGGFTTFSAFALDAVMLAERDAILATAAYVFASVAGAIAALIAGQTVVRLLFV